MAIQMQLRRDSSAQWTSVNPILAQGEMGFEINSGKVKVGDGVHTWNTLPYLTSNLEVIAANLQSQINYIASNTDAAQLDSLTEIVANINARFGNVSSFIANVSANSLVNGSQVVSLAPNGNIDLPNNSVLNSLFSTTVNAPVIDIIGETYVTGNIFVTGNILPTSNVIYDLGSSTARFKDLWLSNSTIHLGSTTISSDESGQLVVGQTFDFGGEGFGGVSYIYWNSSNDSTDNSSPHLVVRINPTSSFVPKFTNVTQGSKFTVTSGSTGNIVALGNSIIVTGATVTVSDPPWLNLYIPVDNFYTGVGNNPGGGIHGAYIHTFDLKASVSGGGGPTGNLIIGDSAINFVASSSGDGYSLSTIELVPDNNAYGNGQFLIVDPTYPNHIHIRAGGPMDNSQTNLILGGEKLRTEVRDYDNTAGIYNETVVNISNTTFYANSADFTTATFTGTSTSGYISLTVVSQDVLNKIWALNSVSRIQLYDGMNSFTVKPDGNTGTPGVGQTANFGIVKVEPSDSLPSNGSTFTEVSFDIKQLMDTKIEVDGSDIRIEAADDVRIYSRDVFMLANYGTGSPVRIVTKYNTENTEWEFRADGNLQLPQTDMTASPQPASYPGITFTDGTHQITAFTGTEFPTNIVNTHNNSSVIYVGGTGASSESLSVRTINDNNALGIEVNYSSANPTTISAFRAYPDPTNIYTGTNSKLAPNTDWDNFGNLTTVGDSMSFTVTDHGFHKIYRVLVIARSMPGGGPGVGDAYCVIEKLKL